MYGEKQAQREYEVGLNKGLVGGGQPMQATAACYDEVAKSPRRTSIRERINRTIREAENVIGRAQAAQRAQAIIDAHPEFAELLDALNEF